MPISSAAAVSLDFLGALGDREVLKDAGHFGVVAGMRNKSVEGRTKRFLSWWPADAISSQP
ncbi:hypothetical protein NXC14_PC00443 (plasmid) [Rhizobium sp. NXC14]|nr:hypothetical protein NXC14_PC00443 [Rhizobium sp. NXC14]